MLSRKLIVLRKHAVIEYNLCARTTADLRDAKKIGNDDIGEVIQSRSLDRQLWG